MLESAYTPDFTETEIAFMRRGLSHYRDGAIDSGVMGSNRLRERWETTNIQRSGAGQPQLDYAGFLRHFVLVIGPDARSRLQDMGWPDAWQLPRRLVTSKTGESIYELLPEVFSNMLSIYDVRLMDVIARLRWAYRGDKEIHDHAVEDLNRAVTADQPYVAPPTMTPEELQAEKDAAKAAYAVYLKQSGSTELERPTKAMKPERVMACYAAKADALLIERNYSWRGMARELFTWMESVPLEDRPHKSADTLRVAIKGPFKRWHQQRHPSDTTETVVPFRADHRWK